jgi:hypothetical protein
MNMHLFCRGLPLSPPEAFTLPSYAEDAAVILARMPSPPASTTHRVVNLDVEQFMDLEAAVGDGIEEHST